MQQNFNLKEIVGSNSFSEVNIRAACKKCGFVGHLPFQCRNYLTLNGSQNKMILDVSSTSSDDGGANFISPLSQLRDDEAKIAEMKKMLKDSFQLNKPIIKDDTVLSTLKKSMKKRLKKKLKKLEDDSSESDQPSKKHKKSHRHKKSHKKHKKHHSKDCRNNKDRN